MDKKLNRTIGYINTTEVVSDVVETTKVVKQKPVYRKMQDIDINDTIADLKAKYGLSDDMIDNGKENTSKVILEPVVILEDRSKRIVDWLKSHPLINKAGLCQAVGFDKGNFKRICDNGLQFRSDVIVKIEEQLSLYGY